MLVAGIDIGGKNVHGVILKDGKLLAKASAPSGINKAKAAEELYDRLLKQADIKRGDIERVVATGSSGGRAAFASGVIPDAAADARAVNNLLPSVKTVIDVGAEEGRAIKISNQGKVLDFAINEKCAAGTGAFVDSMARALETPIEQIGALAMQSTKAIPMNAQCAVFGESEVVSLIHQRTAKPDIARAVHDAIAGRIGSVARIVGLENDIAMVGGVALNSGFIESLKRELQLDIKVPPDPDYIGALGAALAAAAGVKEEQIAARVLERDSVSQG